MIRWFYCKRCNFKFSMVVTGKQGRGRCPRCSSKVDRIYVEKEKELKINENAN